MNSFDKLVTCRLAIITCFRFCKLDFRSKAESILWWEKRTQMTSGISPKEDA